MLHNRQRDTRNRSLFCGLVPHSLLNQWRLSLSGYSTLRPLPPPSWSTVPSAQDAEKLIQGHWAPNTDHIHHSQNSISRPPVTQKLFEYTMIALKSCLSMPVSVATCERSFSALRCLKTYLRSTVMMQKRLRPTHCASLLHIHSDWVDSLDENYVLKNEERTKVFGNPNHLISHCGHQGDQNN